VTASVDLYWLPLGAGGPWAVRCGGRLYEAVVARRRHRVPLDLFHSALCVRLRGELYTVEMAPVWGGTVADRGVVAEGPVGHPWLGRSRAFRYEVRRWRNGRIPDIDGAVASPQRLGTDAGPAERLLRVLPDFPRLTWGLDELGTGDMWNSNSLISWTLAISGHPVHRAVLPPHGRAPGWTAGLVAAAGHPMPARRSSGVPGIDRDRHVVDEGRAC